MIKDEKYFSREVLSKHKWILNTTNGFATIDYNSNCNRSSCTNKREGINSLNIPWLLFMDREYHISENPQKNQIEIFWKEIIKRNISIILVFCSSIPNIKDNSQYNFDWPFSIKLFDDYIIEKTGKEEIKYMNMHYTKYKIKHKYDLQEHSIKIYYLSEWEINKIPESITEFIKLYVYLCKEAKGSPILLHSSYLPDSRISLFVMFIYIVEAMINNENRKNPMEIIKIAKDQGHCGPINIFEFAFLLRSVIEYFTKKEKLRISKSMRNYITQYNQFMEYGFSKINIFDNNLRSFMNYVNTLTPERIQTFYGIHNKICILNEQEIKRRCSKFYEMLEYQYNEVNDNDNDKKIIKYYNIPCYNDEILSTKKDCSKNEQLDEYLHGNVIKFPFSKNYDRKIILCQAPIKRSVKSFIHMLYIHKVTTLVIMDERIQLFSGDENECIKNMEEHHNVGESHYEYLPRDQNSIMYGDYLVQKYSNGIKIGNRLECMRYSIKNTKDLYSLDVNFSVFKFFSHIGEDIIEDTYFYELLYKKIISNNDGETIVLQDPSGISTAAIMTLIIMMVDGIPLYHSFDPVSYFISLRESRYGAIKYDYHFLFALLVAFRRFDNDFSLIREDLKDEMTLNLQYEFRRFKSSYKND
uniref:Tyrosine-protein phosphatase domain-containing protein n=1 Tax=Parastrongyloides trichosuri TaxID=131310 RepID=A0A0N4ZN16_PARTI